MHELNLEEAIEIIRGKDPRYSRDAYLFVREALDHTQKTIARDPQGQIRHVNGQELLVGIREYALSQFGPMAMMVLEEWGIHACQDFGEIVFNMVEMGGSPLLALGDVKDLQSLAHKLRQQADPVSRYLWTQLSEVARQALLAPLLPSGFEAILVKELNQVIRTYPLYERQRFAGIALSNYAKSLVEQGLKGARLAHLNRLLLEDAYPTELAKSGGLLAKTEKDSRADFKDGYDFFEAFRKPFLPGTKQRSHQPAPARSSSN